MASRPTGGRRSAAKEATWRKLIAEWRQSGQTLKAFAEEKGVNYGTARWWGTELKRRDVGCAKPAPGRDVAQPVVEGTGASFIPVQIVASKPRALVRQSRPRGERAAWDEQQTRGGADAAVLQPGTLELLPFGPVRIRVPPDFDPRALRALLDVLEAPC